MDGVAWRGDVYRQGRHLDIIYCIYVYICIDADIVPAISLDIGPVISSRMNSK